MGSLLKRGENTWRITIDVGKKPDGRRDQRYFTFHGNKKQAQAFMARKEVEKQQGKLTQFGPLTVGQILRRFMADHVEPNLAERTREGYSFIINKYLLPAFEKVKVDKLSPLQIQGYLTQLQDKKNGPGLSALTALHHYQVLHSAFARAMRWNMIGYNPVDGVAKPSPERKEFHVLTPEEARHFLEVTKNHRLHVLFLLAITTGMREAEVVGLRWTDIDLSRGFLVVQQTIQKRGKKLIVKGPKRESSRRLVTFTDEVASELREWRNYQEQEKAFFAPDYDTRYEGLVFRTKRGTPLSGRNLVRTFKSLLRAAGLPESVRFHDLRHTAASLGAAAGLQAKDVSERLGHSGIGITMDLYSHLFLGTKKEAAEKISQLLSGREAQTTDDVAAVKEILALILRGDIRAAVERLDSPDTKEPKTIS